MTFLQFLPIAVFIAVQATFMMIIEPIFGFVSWISFQAWAMYFLAGGTPKMGLKTLVGYFGGAVCSVAIMEGAGFFAGVGFGGSTNLYLAVFFVVILVICAERVPGMDFVPSWFVGAGVFFGLMNLDTFAAGASAFDKYLQSTGNLMWSCLFGLVFGAGTVYFRTWYESRLNTAEEPAAVEGATQH